MKVIDSEYLEFQRIELPNRKTPIVVIWSKSSNALLGEIKWYGPWRQFCFYPEEATIFNIGCMDDIKKVITLLMRERDD